MAAMLDGPGIGTSWPGFYENDILLVLREKLDVLRKYGMSKLTQKGELPQKSRGTLSKADWRGVKSTNPPWL